MKKKVTIFSALVCLLCGVQVGMCWGRDWFYVILSVLVTIIIIVGDGINIQHYDDSGSDGEED